MGFTDHGKKDGEKSLDPHTMTALTSPRIDYGYPDHTKR